MSVQEHLKSNLKRVCELQPHYTAHTTPEMKLRGSILRDEVQPAIEGLSGTLSDALGPFGRDFSVKASDGIGRKTELAWVRFASASMSPSPTEGYYCVLHFSTDGSAVHVTVGCGSSRFVNGASVTLPTAELVRRTEWARSVILERFGTIEPFGDAPDFGAKRKLPKSFQDATAISKRVAYANIDTTDFVDLLEQAAVRLRAVYEAQVAGRDADPAELDKAAIEAAINPTKPRGRGQGYGLSGPQRKAVENHAMRMAQDWLERQGFEVEDCSARACYDLIAAKDGEAVKIEVKGTLSDIASSIMMTSNEVDLHQAEAGKTGLIIVSSIRLSSVDDVHTTSGGVIEPLLGWSISDWRVVPTAYRLERVTKMGADL